MCSRWHDFIPKKENKLKTFSDKTIFNVPRFEAAHAQADLEQASECISWYKEIVFHYLILQLDFVTIGKETELGINQNLRVLQWTHSLADTFTHVNHL